jgi:dihydrofolate reductase
MPKVRVNTFAVSLDGFAAGPDQDLENPLGRGGSALHEWFYPTRVFQQMVGGGDGTTGLDNDFAVRAMTGVGAWILGRNMFAPSRGPWPVDDPWQGWWGDEPPYHVPTFILTHHPRPPIEMAGGTTFHFVTDGIEAALEQAKAAAGDLDVRIGGGAATIRQYLQARLIDELHLVMTPVLLGSGEPLFAGLDLPALGYSATERVASGEILHVVLSRA